MTVAETDAEHTGELGVLEDVNDDDDDTDRAWRYLMGFPIYLFLAATLAVPPLMIHSGITFGYCDKYWTDWLIAGGILWVLESTAIIKNWKANRSFNIRKAKNKGAYTLFVCVTAAFAIWTLSGIGPVFAGSMYDDAEPNPMQKKEECSTWVFDMVHWLTIAPFLCLGYIIFIALPCFLCCPCFF